MSDQRSLCSIIWQLTERVRHAILLTLVHQLQPLHQRGRTWCQESGLQAKPGWAHRRRQAQVPAQGREHLQGWLIHHLLTYIQVSNGIEVLFFRNFLISDRFCTNCVKDQFMRHEFIFSIFLRRHGLTESWSGQGQNTWCGGEGTRDHPPPQRHTPLFAKRYSSTDRGKICYTKLFGKMVAVALKVDWQIWIFLYNILIAVF